MQHRPFVISLAAVAALLVVGLVAAGTGADRRGPSASVEATALTSSSPSDSGSTTATMTTTTAVFQHPETVGSMTSPPTFDRRPLQEALDDPDIEVRICGTSRWCWTDENGETQSFSELYGR